MYLKHKNYSYGSNFNLKDNLDIKKGLKQIKQDQVHLV